MVLCYFRPIQTVPRSPEEECLFAEQPPGDFYCPVSKDLLLQPHLTSCCGQHFSQFAAIRIQREGGACPLCKANHWSTMLNKRFQRKINVLQVFCCHKDKGCDWMGNLTNIFLHILSCSHSVRTPFLLSVFTILFITQGPKPNAFPSKFPKYISHPLVSYNGVLECHLWFSYTFRHC